MKNTHTSYIYSNHSIAEFLGKICEIVLPIRNTFYVANSHSTFAICTLSSMKLLKKIKSDVDILDNLAAVGRLLSENKGIDTLVSYCVENKINTLLLCGIDARGHKAGDALLCLHKYGVEGNNNRIVSSSSPYPYVSLSKSYIEKFQNDVNIIDKRGETSWDRIKAYLEIHYGGIKESDNNTDY